MCVQMGVYGQCVYMYMLCLATQLCMQIVLHMLTAGESSALLISILRLDH